MNNRTSETHRQSRYERIERRTGLAVRQPHDMWGGAPICNRLSAGVVSIMWVSTPLTQNQLQIGAPVVRQAASSERAIQRKRLTPAGSIAPIPSALCGVGFIFGAGCFPPAPRGGQTCPVLMLPITLAMPKRNLARRPPAPVNSAAAGLESRL